MSSETTGTGSTMGGIMDVSTVSDLSTFGKARLAGFGLVVLATIGFAVVALGELFSLLVVGWTEPVGAELGIHRLHVMAIALTILTTLLGVFVQAYRPTRQVASMLGAFLSIVVAAGITVGVGESLGSIVPFLLLVGLATVLHPAGRELLDRGQSYSPAMLALVVVAAIPMLAFAVDQVSLQLGSGDPHAAAGHYTVMAQFGLVPLAYGFLAAIGMRGWRVAAWIAAIPVSYYGVLSIAFPAQASSTGVVWGTAAVLWAVGFVVVTEYSRVGTSPALRQSVAGQD
ncbi:hypothetical protein N0B31_11575 [Salinirubellus salinus]|uniref:Uncharacterized protein n=1 Tax=Salinirubellus salinus TaxID=1364945 RepID=A0A9E7QZA4_9EURY|nr:hypothetical protein [Salinirubellus salinus]UWM52791.1 hypothetical protein N0B31_11575 [Salinirubellus salinus]